MHEIYYADEAALETQNDRLTIPTLEVRALKLHEEGLLSTAELDAFRNDDQMTKSKVQALLGGADLDEAHRFAQLVKRNMAIWDREPGVSGPTAEQHDEVRKMALSYLGMTRDEITELFDAEEMYREGHSCVPGWLKDRTRGIPANLGKRREELSALIYKKRSLAELEIDEATSVEERSMEQLSNKIWNLTRRERIERVAYHTLTSILIMAKRDYEIELAIRDIGVERIYDYIFLTKMAEITSDQKEAIFGSTPITCAVTKAVKKLVDEFINGRRVSS